MVDEIGKVVVKNIHIKKCFHFLEIDETSSMVTKKKKRRHGSKMQFDYALEKCDAP